MDEKNLYFYNFFHTRTVPHSFVVFCKEISFTNPLGKQRNQTTRKMIRTLLYVGFLFGENEY